MPRPGGWGPDPGVARLLTGREERAQATSRRPPPCVPSCLPSRLPLGCLRPISPCDGHQSRATRDPGALMLPERLCKALPPMATGCPGSGLRGISVGHDSTHDRYAFPPSRPQGQVPLLPREPSSAETGRRPRAPAAGRGPRGPLGHWSQVSPSTPTRAPTHHLPLSLPGPLPEETPPLGSTPSPTCGLADTPCGAVVQSLGNSTYGHLHGLQKAFLFSPLPEPWPPAQPRKHMGPGPRGLLPAAMASRAPREAKSSHRLKAR